MKRLAIILAVILVPALVQGFEQVQFRKKLGQEGSGPGQLKEPYDVAIGDDGLMYIADRGNRRIHVMSRDGRTINTWRGGTGTDSKLEAPAGIAVYGNRVYVTDAELDRVFVFYKSGTFVESFGGSGSGPKQFDEPRGICVHQGIVYVADTGNHRVQRFSLDGIYLGSIGKKGDGTGEMDSPTDVAVDHRGYIYVSEEGNDRVGVFLPSGHHYRYYYGVKDPVSVAVDSKGFFVASAGDYKVKKINLESKVILSFGTRGKGNAQFLDMSGITVDRDGYIIVTDAEKNSIQIFAPERMIRMSTDLAAPPDSVRWTGETKATVADMIWYRDRLFATDPENNALLIIQDGAVKRIIKGQGANELDSPWGITVDRKGFFWIADSDNDRIVKVDADGRVLMSLGESGSDEGEFSSPRGLTISDKGIIYVADSGNERVQIFNTSGVYISRIEKMGREEFDEPYDVTLDPRGNIYVVDRGLNSVGKYDAGGRFLMYIGGEGEGDGRFSEPTSAVVLGNELFVLDSGNSRVQVFDLKGRFLRKFGAPGGGKGDFVAPSSIVAKDDTTVFISDPEAKRVQEIVVLRTPRTPSGFRAVPGVSAITLSWNRNPETFVRHYRIYRSDNGMDYRVIASPSGNSFRDDRVERGRKYYYRVSAVAGYGTESAMSPALTAHTRKAVVMPPTGVRAVAGEREIRLRWQPGGDPSVISHYVIYREIDGSLRRIGEVRTTSFTDRGLTPEREYVYSISAVSVDNEESEGMRLRVRTVLTRPPLSFETVNVRDIFPRAARVYAEQGIGKLRITNNSGKKAEDVKVSFIIGDFMDRAAVVKAGDIAPRGSVLVALKPVVFNNRILLLKDSRSVDVKIDVKYMVGGVQKTQTARQSLMVILTGRKYTKTQIKKYTAAVSALEKKVVKGKLYRTVRQKIMREFDTTYSTIKKLRDARLRYGEVIACLYINTETGQTVDSLLGAVKGGRSWVDLMSIFDLDIGDVTDTINSISRSLKVKKKPKPRRRRMETDRYIKQ